MSAELPSEEQRARRFSISQSLLRFPHTETRGIKSFEIPIGTLMPFSVGQLAEQAGLEYFRRLNRRNTIFESLKRVGLSESGPLPNALEAIVNWTIVLALAGRDGLLREDESPAINLVEPVAKQGDTIATLLFGHEIDGKNVANSFFHMKSDERTEGNVIRKVAPAIMAAAGVSEEAIAAFCFSHDEYGIYQGAGSTIQEFGCDLSRNGVMWVSHAIHAEQPDRLYLDAINLFP